MALSGEAYRLWEACAEPGCPICTRVRLDVARYLDRLLYENVNDTHIRAKIREARGFCNRHAYLLSRPGGSLGIAVIYRDVLERVLRTLDEARWRGGEIGSKALSDALAPKQACPVCVREAEAEMAYARALAEELDAPSLLEAFKESDGLCLRHFRTTLGMSSKREVFEVLSDMQRTIWNRLSMELAEFIQQADSDLTSSEGDSWQRIVTRLRRVV
ncbi:MAG: hypothetical protein JXB47_18615 [Anaerolineae bacterium]|nr:hypothetical protein [Anaerolineae bacterium]